MASKNKSAERVGKKPSKKPSPPDTQRNALVQLKPLEAPLESARPEEIFANLDRVTEHTTMNAETGVALGTTMVGYNDLVRRTYITASVLLLANTAERIRRLRRQ